MTEALRGPALAARLPSLPRIVLTVFAPFAGGYFMSYLYRSVNAVIAPNLVAEFTLSAGDLGLLTSVYFAAFALFQIPLGILLDRFGPRRVQACLLLSAVAGAIVFALGTGYWQLLAGRALIGLGVCGGLMSSFKAIVMWFPKERWPLVNGCFMGMGGLGALAATTPVEALLGLTDWRGIFLGMAAMNVAASAAIFLIVPERPTGGEGATLRQALQSIGAIYRDRFFWRLAPLGIGTMGIGMAFQGLWVAPWLRDVVGFDRAVVAQHLFFLTLLLTAGFVLGGVVADVLTRRGLTLMQILGWGMLLFIATQLPLVLGWPGGLWVVLVGIGVLSNVGSYCYPMLSGHFPQNLSGRSNTALNLLVFGGGAFGLQYAIGAVIDLFPRAANGGYAPAGYQAAFGAALLLQVLGFLWFLVPHQRKQPNTSH